MVTTEPTSAWWPWTRDWWVAPLLVIEVAGSIGANHERTALHLALAGVLAGLATLVLLAWRRWPLAALLGNAALTCAYFATGQDNGPILFTPVIATFLMARSRPPRVTVPWVAVEIGVGILGLALRSALWGDWSGGQALGQSIVTIAVLFAAAAFGNNQRTRHEARADRARRAASEEQLRMAQDLHDGVGHGLAVIAMQAGVALHVLERDPDKARESLEAIRDTSRESLAALRAEIGRLAPAARGPAPLVPRNGIDDLPALVDRVRAGGLELSLDTGGISRLPEAVDGTIYLVVQEALTNVLRHSGAGSAAVRLYDEHAERSVLATVTDDGQGGPVHEGMGLTGMRARVEALGGSLAVGPSPEGFMVWARIPLGRR
ncbi:MAG: sensor histidine kinase [Marmoricola sp.]